MNSIRVKNKNVYEIEVNDNGDIIQFDLTDVGLPFALDRSYKMIRDAEQWLAQQKLIIGKKSDTKKNGDIFGEKQRLTMEAYAEFFNRMRAAIDAFAGEGASNKIFGHQNYVEMFNDFMEQMKPHIDAMKIKMKDYKRAIEEKYGATVDDEL